MEQVIRTDGLVENICRYLTLQNLINLRAATHECRAGVGFYLNEQRVKYKRMFDRRLQSGSHLHCELTESEFMYCASHVALYNYYHMIVRLSFVIPNEIYPFSLAEFSKSLRDTRTDVTGPACAIIIRSNRVCLQYDRTPTQDYSLYDIMSSLFMNKSIIDISHKQHLKHKLLPIV